MLTCVHQVDMYTYRQRSHLHFVKPTHLIMTIAATQLQPLGSIRILSHVHLWNLIKPYLFVNPRPSDPTLEWTLEASKHVPDGM